MTTRAAGEIRDHATEFMDDAQAVAIDDTIWWAVGRRAILETFLARAARGREKDLKILEIGCGSGGDLPLLARHGKVWGLERSSILAQRARARNVAQDVHVEDAALDLVAANQIDLYCMFDVLEHIEDDHGFVKNLSSKAAPDHQYLLTVPAYQFLFGPHDHLLHHHRRYTRTQLKAVLEQNGYEVVASSYFMFFLFPLAVVSRLAEVVKARFGKKSTEVNIGRVARPINSLFIAILRLEAFLGRYIRFPFGLWIMMLARRRP
jgi:SAM-dependent methyltransferase